MANENELMLVFGAKIADAQKALNDVKGGLVSLGKEVPKVTQKTEENTGATLRNWRETNRMSGSFQNAAFQMSGMSGFGMQAFRMMDNLGDSLERNAIRGRSFKDVLGGMKAELGMMVSAGVVAGAIAVFKNISDSIKEVDELSKKIETTWNNITVDMYEQKLKRVKHQYDTGAISIEEYRRATINLNTTLINIKAKEEIDKITKSLAGLAKQQSILAAVSAGGGTLGTIIANIWGAGDAEKIQKLTEDIQATQKGAAEKIKNIVETTGWEIEGIQRAQAAKELEITVQKNDSMVAMTRNAGYISNQMELANLRARQNMLTFSANDEIRMTKLKTAAELKIEQDAQRRKLQLYTDYAILTGQLIGAAAMGEKDIMKQMAKQAIDMTATLIQKQLAIKAAGYFAVGNFGMAALAVAGIAVVEGIKIAADNAIGNIGGGITLTEPTLITPAIKSADSGGVTNRDSGSLGGAQSVTVYQSNTVMIQGNVYADDLAKRIFDTILASNRAAGAAVAGGL